MDIDKYQMEAIQTERKYSIDREHDALVVGLLGLAGETGSLATLYKKWIRDGDAYQIMDERLKEELGDILWYLALIANKSNLKLSDVATANLTKVRSRWLQSDVPRGLFDEESPERERLPRKFTAEIRDFPRNNQHVTELMINGTKAGDHLTDNAYSDDGYRFHDIFHLSYAVLLGWSPVFRANLGKKRKSMPQIDEVEDGGRAIAIEEGISALVFSYAKKHSFLEGVMTIDWPLLRTCQEMASHLEVASRSLNEWEQTILKGYEVWRSVRINGGGTIKCDLSSRTFEYVG